MPATVGVTEGAVRPPPTPLRRGQAGKTTDGRTERRPHLHVSSTPVMSAVSLSPTQRPDGQTHYSTLSLAEERRGPEMTHSRGFVLFSVFASLARNSHAGHNVIFLFPRKPFFSLFDEKLRLAMKAGQTFLCTVTKPELLFSRIHCFECRNFAYV